MTALPEQDQPLLRSLLQPAGPVGSQAWEIWRDLLSKIQTDRPRMGAEGKGREAHMQIGKSFFCNPVSQSCPKTDGT